MFFRSPKVVSISTKNFENLTTKTFDFKIKGQKHHGFIVRKENKFYAYLNLCQHLPVTLDLRDNNFFTHDRSALQCHMHGAIYTIETGECTEGPCLGTKLKSLPLVVEEDRVVITIPTSELG